MKITIDFKTDNADDLILSGDILQESDPGISTVKNAERRITARYDDFLLDNIGCGVERYIQKQITETTKSILETEIKRSLSSFGLLLSSEYAVKFLDIPDSRTLPVLLKFTSPILRNADNFKVVVNLQDQRAYR